MNRDFELNIVRNPITHSLFNTYDQILIAAGPPEFVITDDDLYVETNNGELVTTD